MKVSASASRNLIRRIGPAVVRASAIGFVPLVIVSSSVGTLRAQSLGNVSDTTNGASRSNGRPKGSQAPGRNGVVPLARFRGSVRVAGAYRVIETAPGDRYHGVTVNGLYASDIQRSGIRLRGDIRNITIRNFALAHREEPNRAPDLPEGIHIEDGDGVLIEDGTLSGYRMSGLKYLNGDGIAVERGVTNVVIRRVTASGNSDSAFDLLKGGKILLDNVTGETSDRCVKSGARDVTITRITCRAIRYQALQARGGSVTIDEFVYDNAGATRPIILFLVGRADLVVRHCTFLSVPPKGSRLLVREDGARTPISIDPSCRWQG